VKLPKNFGAQGFGQMLDQAKDAMAEAQRVEQSSKCGWGSATVGRLESRLRTADRLRLASIWLMCIGVIALVGAFGFAGTSYVPNETQPHPSGAAVHATVGRGTWDCVILGVALISLAITLGFIEHMVRPK
jgi:hypothetical protein